MKEDNQKLDRIQIFFVGSKNSGKTSLVNKYIDKQFKENFQPTLGIQHYHTTIQIKQKKYKLTIGDSQGFDSNTEVTLIPIYKNIHGFIVVYDITDKKSYQNIKLECKPENQNIYIIGNKNELSHQRQVPTDEAMAYFDNKMCNLWRPVLKIRKLQATRLKEQHLIQQEIINSNHQKKIKQMKTKKQIQIIINSKKGRRVAAEKEFKQNQKQWIMILIIIYLQNQHQLLVQSTTFISYLILLTFSKVRGIGDYS